MRSVLTTRNKLVRLGVILLQKTALFSALSLRLVQITGKHRDRVHPKHLVRMRKSWYLQYIKKRDIVLDVGCNNGQHTLKAARKCKKISAFDYDEKVLQLAKREAQRLKIKNAVFKWGDAQRKFSYENNVFDAVIFLDVFEHLTKRKKTLKEIFRVLKPKGFLFISIPKSDTSWKNLQKSLNLSYFSDPDHKVEFTQEEIENILETSGFKIKKISPVTLDTPLVGFIDMLGGISLSAYRYVSKWRRQMAFRYPKESIGLEILCQKKQE